MFSEDGTFAILEDVYNINFKELLNVLSKTRVGDVMTHVTYFGESICWHDMVSDFLGAFDGRSA